MYVYTCICVFMSLLCEQVATYLILIIYSVVSNIDAYYSTLLTYVPSRSKARLYSSSPSPSGTGGVGSALTSASSSRGASSSAGFHSL